MIVAGTVTLKCPTTYGAGSCSINPASVSSFPTTATLTINGSSFAAGSYSLSITGANPLSYSALTSLQPGGPVFAWKDYSAIGQDITTNFTALTAKTAKDEGIAGPINIGFTFPFFSGGQSPGVFTQLYVSPNGFVSFSPFAGDTSTNQPLPSSSAPTNLIAFFWDDLDLGTTGHVYTYSDALAGTFTIQFQDARLKGTSSTVTCQLILKTTGEIVMQYKTMAVSNSCTVGVQNAAGNQGLQAAFNQNYLQPNFCILFTPAPWVVLDANAGLVPGAKTNLIGLTLNVAGLGYGTNRATILIQTSDPLNSAISLPVELDVTALGTWRQTHFGSAANLGTAADNADPDGDQLVNILEYAFNTDPNVPNGSPLVYALSGGHLTVTFTRPHPAPPDISYFFEVTDINPAFRPGARGIYDHALRRALDEREDAFPVGAEPYREPIAKARRASTVRLPQHDRIDGPALGTRVTEREQPAVARDHGPERLIQPAGFMLHRVTRTSHVYLASPVIASDEPPAVGGNVLHREVAGTIQHEARSTVPLPWK